MNKHFSKLENFILSGRKQVEIIIGHSISDVEKHQQLADFVVNREQIKIADSTKKENRSFPRIKRRNSRKRVIRKMNFSKTSKKYSKSKIKFIFA